MYGGLIGTHQRSFEWYHPRPPMASHFSTLGACNLATPLISGTGKARLQIWRVHLQGQLQ